MVIAHHLVWTVYGSWLPNDPRGSMSTYIQSDPIRDLGELHFGRKRVQPASNVIRTFYDSARPRLTFPSIPLACREFSVVGNVFAEVIHAEKYTCYACAIMPDHVHMIFRKHRDKAEMMIEKLQARSRSAVIGAGKRETDHPVWGGPGWKVFLDSVEDVERTVRYVEQNPIKARMPVQNWSFVTPYDGWPFRKRS